VVGGPVVVVVVPGQTNEPSGEPAPHESQQLVPLPTHACPPDIRGGKLEAGKD
jgi:hypothetical protein